MGCVMYTGHNNINAVERTHAFNFYSDIWLKMKEESSKLYTLPQSG